MTAGVPRVAAFDDLRVGQWVAWESVTREPRAGTITEFHGPVAVIDSGKWRVRGDIQWVILRDVPAPPVQVRREDYDALQACVTPDGFVDLSDMGTYKNNLHRVIRALIDNADLGDT